MMRTKLRKLLRRLILWALTDPEPVTLINWNVHTGMNRFDAADVFIQGASTKQGHSVIVKTIKQAKISREL